MHAPVHASVYVHTTWQAAYNDSFKLQLINEHYASLPEDAWAMTPDVDERTQTLTLALTLTLTLTPTLTLTLSLTPNPDPNPSP